jgi:hypothetical protein
MIGFIILVAATVTCVVIARDMALRKGRSQRAWMWATAFFGVFSLAVLALLPTRDRENGQQNQGQTRPT